MVPSTSAAWGQGASTGLLGFVWQWGNGAYSSHASVLAIRRSTVNSYSVLDSRLSNVVLVSASFPMTLILACWLPPAARWPIRHWYWLSESFQASVMLVAVAASQKAGDASWSAVVAALSLPWWSTARSCTVYRAPGVRSVKVWNVPVDTTVSQACSPWPPFWAAAPDAPAGLIFTW